MYHMLIVDDNTAEAECVRFLTRKFFASVITHIAGNGRDALEAFKTEKFDILLTDIKMPHMDGLELSASIRKTDGEIPIILLSGFNDFSYARTAISLGVSEYLLKPVEPEEFRQTLASVLQAIDKRKKENVENRQLQRRVLYMLLNGVSVGNCEECLPHYTVMVLLAFEKDFFNGVGESFEADFQSEFTASFGFVSPYPSQGVIFFQNGVGDIDALSNEILAFVKRRYGASCRVAAASLQGFRDIAAAYQELDGICRAEEGERSQTDVGRLMDDMTNALRQNDTASFRSYYDVFRNLLRNGKSFSCLYTKYGISKLLAFMTRSENAGITESQIVNQVFTCRDVAELDRVIRQELEKIDSQNDSVALGKVNEIKRFIEKNYASELSLKDIAAAFYFSPNYLCRLFKQGAGQTVLQYVNDYRMKKAQELLETTSMKVGSVAQAVGYHSPSYFCQCFRDCIGVSPETYRRSALYPSPAGREEDRS